ncbi:hypothetical protein EJA72_07535 [Pseudomonas sp. PB120]|uniref:hypothetical protein n=1 Tax=Pseudomonas sp. PB120 TaxID=2494700 RepID=UPI0012FE4EEE|nr:hypothetical protein [Pseudomonas sp. PB120]MVV48096.1 hypothetical protein [Pseudomonas sp. PB120]
MNRSNSGVRSIILSMLVATGLALAVSRNAAAESGAVDFSPGDASQLFALPVGMWSNINQFAFLVCLDEPGVKATLNDRLNQLGGYAELRSSCQVWGSTTFSNLQTLATELASDDMKQFLLRLQTAVQNLSNNTGGARGEFDQAADNISKKLTTLSELSQQVNQQSMAFKNASDSVIGQYRKNNPPDSSWVNIGPKMEDVGLAMGSMVGRWNMLTSNLAYLRKTVALPAGTSGIPQLYDLDLEVGLNAWDEISRRARQFLADMPAQNAYLSGANYYQNCPLDENRWYLMTNSFLSDKGYVLTARRPGPVSAVPQHTAGTIMKPRARQNDQGNYNEATSQQWRFHRYGKGWWGIESRIRNDTGSPAIFLLGTTAQVERVMQGQGGVVSKSYWWRCLKTDSSGWFRLANASLGDLKILDTYNNPDTFFPGFMGNTKENYSGQFWKLEPVANP